MADLNPLRRRTFTVSCRAAACHLTEHAGSPADRTSSSPLNRCPVSFAGFSQTPDRGLQRRRLCFFGDLASLAELDAFAGRIKAVQRVNRVVYAKRPFGGLSRPLHPSRRDRQQPARSTRRRSCRLLMEGLSPKQRDKDHEAQARRVHSPLSASYTA
jgi:hypothetical protein